MTVRILVGDALEQLRTLPDDSAQTCVTSPPYWGLRDYGVPPTVWGGDAACAHEWGEEGKRHRGGPSGKDTPATIGRSTPAHRDKTKDIRTGRFCIRCNAWRGALGLEPSPELYVEHVVTVMREVRRVIREDGTLWLNIGDSYSDSGRGSAANSTLLGGRRSQDESRKVRVRETTQCGLPPKNLVGVPWMLAFAMRADGWILRADIIWHKRNPMPESVRDRPTKAHEYLFLFSRSPRYYYDAEAIAEPAVTAREARWAGATSLVQGDSNETGVSTRRFKLGRSGNSVRRSAADRGVPMNGNGDLGSSVPWQGSTRNKRSVWTVTSRPFPGAHFATFPPDLITPCILAGAPRGGVVLDPFGGAGTTGLVADSLGRDAVLVELNPEYAGMARERIRQKGRGAPDVQVVNG